MTLYTVEVTTPPVEDGDWTVLLTALDTVPGTVLLRDEESPSLLIPVDATSPMRAAMFVDGLSKVLGFQVLSGEIYETPDADEYDEDNTVAPSAVARTVTEWVDSVPPIRATRDRDVHASA